MFRKNVIERKWKIVFEDGTEKEVWSESKEGIEIRFRGEKVREIREIAINECRDK